MKKICIIRLGDFVHGLLLLISFGWSVHIAKWFFVDILGKESCGCIERQRYLNELFGCEEKGIKLN